MKLSAGKYLPIFLTGKWLLLSGMWNVAQSERPCWRSGCWGCCVHWKHTSMQPCEPVRQSFESKLSQVINLESPDNSPNPPSLQNGSWGLATHANSYAGKTRLHCNKLWHENESKMKEKSFDFLKFLSCQIVSKNEELGLNCLLNTTTRGQQRHFSQKPSPIIMCHLEAVWNWEQMLHLSYVVYSWEIWDLISSSMIWHEQMGCTTWGTCPLRMLGG